MSERLSRRQFTTLASGLLAAPLAGLLGRSAAAQEPVHLRFFWWGGENRAQRTLEAISIYMARNPHITIDAETLGWDAYWPRLATHVAGGSPPDIIQMDYQQISEYARRGALLPLDEFRSNPLTIDDFGEQTLRAGVVDEKLYGVIFGVGNACFIYDRTVLEQHGLPVPSLTWTWQEYADLAVEVTKATPDGYYGSSDPGSTPFVIQTFIRQRGKELYGQGQLGCDLHDIEDWFGFVDDLRKRGGCVPAEVQALDPGESVTQSMLTLGKAAMIDAGANLLIAYQAAVTNQLGMTMHPHGERPGQFLSPTMFLSISPSAAKKEECARFINFLVHDEEAAAVLKVERGVPPSAAMRDYLTTVLTDVEKTFIEYVSAISDKVVPLPPPPPTGASEVAALIKRTNAQIGFGEMSVSDASKEFVEAANRILGRA